MDLGLAKQLTLIDKAILGKELIKVTFATTERLASSKLFCCETHEVAFV